MATLAVTVPAGSNAKAVLDRLSIQIRELTSGLSDITTGGATTITFDNAPTTGVVSVQLTAGPHSSSKKGLA